jgi:uncharacterized protein YukJ
MPVENYGILKCRAIDTRLERTDDTPHFQIHCVDDNKNHYRAVVNVMSKQYPSELLYLIDFEFPFKKINAFSQGTAFTALNKGLDYIRDNFFNPRDMAALAFDIPGEDNDLLELLDNHIKAAIKENAYIYIFGSRFENKEAKDRIFRFSPLVGMHNIHMNQGNMSEYSDNNGIYNDGALFIHYENEPSCTAIFLAFQSQSWCTDDSGHAINQCTPKDIV